MLKGLIETLRRYDMEIAEAKTVWMEINAEGTGPNILKAADKILKKCSTFNYLGSIINSTGEPNEAITANIIKAKKCLIKLRPFI